MVHITEIRVVLPMTGACSHPVYLFLFSSFSRLWNCAAFLFH